MTKNVSKEIELGKIIPLIKPTSIDKEAAQTLADAVSSIFTLMSLLRDMTEEERGKFFRRIKPIMSAMYEVTCYGMKNAEPKTARRRNSKR